jgi:hypothetical protein
MAAPDPHEVKHHVSPYRRIEIGARTPDPQPAPQESALSKAIREAAEEKQRVEHARIWNHVVQTAQGCNAITGEAGE